MKRLVPLMALIAWFAVASTAHAAFPARNGVLAVQPLHADGIVLVGADGRGQRRICTTVSRCGHPGRPRFSPDGRSIIFSGPAIRLIGTDGSCQNCQFGVAQNPAFLPGGALVTFVSGGRPLEDGIDGLRRAVVSSPAPLSDAVWSASGTLAVVASGRLWVGQPGKLRAIARGSEPSWSPDGTRLAVVQHGWIAAIRVASGSARRLVRGTAPAFSPDGRWVAYIGLKHEVRVIGASGGRSRAVGAVRGRAVDWQPRPAHPPACVAPPGAKVLAQSAQAVLVETTGPGVADELLPDTAAIGCLFADGRERLLEQSLFNSIDGAVEFPTGAVAAPYAAVVSRNYDEHYGGETQAVGVFDLRTGKPSGFGGETVGCASYAPCNGIGALVLGSDGVSAAYTGGGSTGGSTDSLTVSCVSQTFCLANNRYGDILSATDPSSSPWTPALVKTFLGLSCPSTSLCVGVTGGTIYTSTDPMGGSGAWSATSVSGAPNLQNVSCASASLCVASTSSGDVLVSTDPTGGPGAWTRTHVDNTWIYGISCPTNSECVAGDLSGNAITTTDPTGGPGAWTVQPAAPKNSLDKVVCPSASLCLGLAFGEVLISTDPTSGQWSTTQRGSVADISCPSATFCVSLGSSNTIRISTDPASGSWSSYSLASATNQSLQSISCPTSAFCVAAGIDNGDVMISTNPSGGPSTWSSVLADRIDCSTAPGACGTEKIIASDGAGMHLIDSSTEFEPQTGPQLTGLNLNGDMLGWSHGGSPRTAQLTP